MVFTKLNNKQTESISHFFHWLISFASNPFCNGELDKTISNPCKTHNYMLENYLFITLSIGQPLRTDFSSEELAKSH